MRFFNTAGPIKTDIHYYLPPLERINQGELLQLIDEEKYFVLHAPRQTGKTSCLLALQDYLNREGRYACVYCNVELAQSAREDVDAALHAIIGQMALRAQIALGDDFLFEQLLPIRAEAGEHGMLNHLLTIWAKHSAKPIVLLIDEIDSLIGNTLKLLTAFQQFFREHSEHWVERFDYKEAGPQLLLQAFLQRIVNGGGRIEREYGLGRKRTDLLVLWNFPGGVQRVVLELKVGSGTSESLLNEGLTQTAGYMDRCGAQEGHLVIFDRNPARTWEEKISHRTATHGAYTIHVWGM